MRACGDDNQMAWGSEHPYSIYLITVFHEIGANLFVFCFGMSAYVDTKGIDLGSYHG